MSDLLLHLNCTPRTLLQSQKENLRCWSTSLVAVSECTRPLCQRRLARSKTPSPPTPGSLSSHWPAVLSQADCDDISEWLDMLKRKIGRSVAPAEPKSN